MAREGKKQTILDVVLNVRWPVPAALAVVMLVLGYAVLPPILGATPITAPLAEAGRTAFGWLGLLFGCIAIYKRIAERNFKKLNALPMVEVKAVDSIQPGPGEVISKSPREAWDNPEPITILPSEGDQDSPKPVPRFQREAFPAAKPTEWSLELLQSIEWKRFEDLCAVYYREMGIRTETTSLGAGGGVDIRLYEDADSSRFTAIVQCKLWGDKCVGVNPLRDLLDVVVHEDVARAIFISPGGFTDDARKFAEANNITLLDGKGFLAMLGRLPAEARSRLLAYATKGSYTVPTCPGCGQKMAPRSGPTGDYWACHNFPSCSQTLAIPKGTIIQTPGRHRQTG
jgi:restriction system protein